MDTNDADPLNLKPQWRSLNLFPGSETLLLFEIFCKCLNMLYFAFCMFCCFAEFLNDVNLTRRTFCFNRRYEIRSTFHINFMRLWFCIRLFFLFYGKNVVFCDFMKLCAIQQPSVSTLWFDIYEYSGVTLERSKYEWFLSSYWSLNWRTRRRHERYIKGQPHVSHLRYHILFIHLYV